MSLDRSGSVIPEDSDGEATSGDGVDSTWVTTLLDRIDGRWSELTITLTGTQNNVSITSGGVEADVLRCNNASLLTITGIAAPASPAKPAKRLIVMAVGAGQVDINDSSAALGTAANRVVTGVGTTISLAAGTGAALLEYDDTTDRYRVVAFEQGAAIAYTPTLGSVTLGNGSVAGAYIRRGRLIFWQVVLTLGSTTTIGAGPVTVSLPVTASSTTSPASQTTGTAIDSSAGPAYYAVNAIPNSTSVVSLTSNASPMSGLATGVPFTWANTDVLAAGGWYIPA